MIAVQGQRQRPGEIRQSVRVLGVIWGLGGIAAVLVYAAISLGRYALEAVAAGLGPVEWLVLAVNTALMAWAEGYRGFQQRFSPRVAARALDLYLQPTIPRLMLAPLFCTGFFAATARLLRTIWVGTGLILLAVLFFNELPQPCRGILDAGVMVGLIWGVASLMVATGATFHQRREIVAAEVLPKLGEGAGL